MTTIADIRDRVRKDLHDTDPADERWTDGQLDRHIERALRDLTLAIPREASATIATTPGSRDISIAGLTDLVLVEAVEYPVDEFPPSYVRFSRWEDTLSLHLARAPQGEDARVYYTAAHAVDGSGSTLPPHLEDVLATGAAAYAALERSAFTVERITTGDDVSRQYAAWGRAWETAFRELLRGHARANRVRRRRLYVPA